MHGMLGTLGCIFRLMKASAKHLFLYRYDAVPIIERAFTDFLSGPEFLISTNAEELNRSVMAMSPSAVELNTVAGWSENIRSDYKIKKDSHIRAAVRVMLLGGHIIPNILLKKKTAFIPLAKAKDKDTFLSKITVQYQISTDQGYVFKKNSFRFFASVFKCAKIAFMILFKYRKVSKKYQNSKELLTSYEFWTKYLGLD